MYCTPCYQNQNWLAIDGCNMLCLSFWEILRQLGSESYYDPEANFEYDNKPLVFVQVPVIEHRLKEHNITGTL